MQSLAHFVGKVTLENDCKGWVLTEWFRFSS